MNKIEGEPTPGDKELESREATKLWIVDDNEELLGSLQRITDGNEGLEASTFKSGSGVVAEFKKAIEDDNLPDVILLDYDLKKAQESEYETGVEVIKKLEELVPSNEQLPEIVAHSSDKSYAQKLIEAGANDSVKKPLESMNYLREIGD